MAICQATGIGAGARRLILRPGFHGQVTASLPDVIYLSGRDGEIVWIFREGMPDHGRGIRIASFPSGFAGSGEFRVEGGRLIIGTTLAINLGGVAEWRFPSPEPGRTAPLSLVCARVRRLLETLVPAVTGGGGGAAVLGLASMLRGFSGRSSLSGPWQPPVISRVCALMVHCLQRGLRDIDSDGRELIGLGAGLTPCGDDFLGGLFFAARWLEKACLGKCDDGPAISRLLRWAEGRTHPLSCTLLRDLALGEGPEPLHRLLWLLLNEEDQGDRPADAAFGLLKIGHSTGRYVLAGALTCLLSAEQRRNRAAGGFKVTS